MRAGSEFFRPSVWGPDIVLRISWSNCTFEAGDIPNVNAEIINYNFSPFHNELGTVDASWDGNYRIKLDFTPYDNVPSVPSIFYVIPNNYYT